MNRYQYRCNRCLIIEDEWVHNGNLPSNSVPCHKCGGVANRLPPPTSEKDPSPSPDTLQLAAGK